jgi:biotin synthase-like enzyme
MRHADKSRRHAAGINSLMRESLIREAVLLASANSIFYGEKLLTTPNPTPDSDDDLLEEFGWKPMQLLALANRRDASRRLVPREHYLPDCP